MIHDGDPVADMAGQRQVVGNVEKRRPPLLNQGKHQVQNFRSDRNIEHRNGLVCNHELGIQNESPRNCNSLPLPSAHLMRESVHEFLRWNKFDFSQDLLDSLIKLITSFGYFLDSQRFGNNILDHHSRIQGLEGILKDDLHFFPKRLELFRRKVRNVLALIQDLSFSGIGEPYQEPACGGFSASTFSHES